MLLLQVVWYVFPLSDMRIIGFYIDKIKAWAVS